jgi:tight adherence protein B
VNRRLLLSAVALATLVLVPGIRNAAAAEQLTVTGVDGRAPGRTTIAVSIPAGFSSTPLTAKDWTVRESGVRRHVDVTGLPDDPAQVVLVMDTSGSMRGNALASSQGAARTFVDRMPTGVSLAVVGFGDRPYVASGFTTDHGATKNAIDTLHASGETAFYDAIGTATGLFTPGTHHALVAMTDGKDTSSAANLGDAANAITGAHASYDGIALTTSDSDLQAVQTIADATGGRATSADAPGALDGAYRAVATTLTSQYRLTVATKGAGSHVLRVTAHHGDATASGTTRADLTAPTATNRHTTPASVAPAATTATRPGFWSGSLVLWLGLAVLFAGLLIGFAQVFAPRARRSQLAGSTIAGVRNGSSVITSLGDRVTDLADRGLAGNDRAGRLERALARAGIAMRPSEFVVLAAIGTFAAFAGALLLFGFLPALVLASVVPLTCRLVVTHKGNRRSERFQDQLEQTLPLMAGSLRAGFGLMQSLDAVARESESPTSEEFHRLVVESRLGRDLGESLGSVAERMRSEDFDWVVQAIEIHRQVGGDLAQVLDNVYATIRDRNRIRRQIKALSAEGRLSALILFALPFCMFGVISVLNPDYITELTSHGLGIAMLVVAGVMLTIGGLWLKRITRLVF